MIRGNHESLHDLFGVLTPHEQIEFLLDLNSTVLTKQVKYELRSTLNRFEQKGDIYLPKAFN